MNKTHVIHPTTSYVATLPLESKSSNLQQITNIMIDETNHILSHSLADTATVTFTTVARNVHFLPAHTLEDAYATRQLHHQ